MKPVDARKARRAAESKGFVDEGGDHHYMYLHHDGKRTTWRIKLSRSGDYERLHIKKDARACGEMRADDLFKIVNCDHDGDWVKKAYENWREKQP